MKMHIVEQNHTVCI